MFHKREIKLQKINYFQSKKFIIGHLSSLINAIQEIELLKMFFGV